MEWVDEAIVLGLRHHGESAVIAELLTKERGRHKGFVHGGRSRRLRPVLQPGNRVRATWHSRQEDGLGRLELEPLTLRAATIMEAADSLQAANLVCALARLLPEREPHKLLFAMADAILDHLTDALGAAAALVRLELALLRELGFGLDLSCCAVSGALTDLAYVSPISGRAVTRVVGDPYRDRILPLPSFLNDEDQSGRPGREAIFQGFDLTEHFLRRDVFVPRGLPVPESRGAYLQALEKRLSSG